MSENSEESVDIQPVKRVLIMGGIHGNELSGVFLTRYWSTPEGALELQRRTLDVFVEIGNPKAVQTCRRLIDDDLNRAFQKDPQPLSESGPHSYERQRASEIHQKYGNGNTDFLIDLHSTTSNVGIVVVIMFYTRRNSEDVENWLRRNRKCWLAFHVAQHLRDSVQKCSPPLPLRVVAFESSEEPHHIVMPNNFGLSVDVGSEPHGVVRADVVERLRLAVKMSLDFLESLNDVERSAGDLVKVFLPSMKIPYPIKKSRLIDAWDKDVMIHPELQDRDFCKLDPGQPAFLRADGEVIPFKGSRSTYPIFINESSYYEENIAFWVSDRISVRLPNLLVNSPRMSV